MNASCSMHQRGKCLRAQSLLQRAYKTSCSPVTSFFRIAITVTSVLGYLPLQADFLWCSDSATLAVSSLSLSKTGISGCIAPQLCGHTRFDIPSAGECRNTGQQDRRIMLVCHILIYLSMSRVNSEREVLGCAATPTRRHAPSHFLSIAPFLRDGSAHYIDTAVKASLLRLRSNCAY